MVNEMENGGLPKVTQNKFDKQYEANNNAYYEEAESLGKTGWRSSTNTAPPIMAGSPELEERALDQITRKPLPDGTKQTAIRVLNLPVVWGDSEWFVKDGVQPAPGPDYEVIVREAKDGRWVNVEQG